MSAAVLLLSGCDLPTPPADAPAPSATLTSPSSIPRDTIYDRVLGMLVGSAIGDAMGAPTEMWSRHRIMVNYGFVDRLDTMVRAPSAEGTWKHNLPAGGTTDDTRWKKLMADYVLQQSTTFGNVRTLDARAFADHLTSTYKQSIEVLQQTKGFAPAPYEANHRRMAWLQEWAQVARPYAAADLEGYSLALHRFYGGEMTCAGLLYTPLIGAYFPKQPERAYQEAYKLSIFDLGYARDVSAITAAMVAAAMAPEVTPRKVMNVLRDVDPHGYFKSRLVGRATYRIFQQAQEIVYAAQQLSIRDVDTANITPPAHLPVDTLFIGRMQRAYTLLDQRQQDMPFHAGEIHLVNLTALLFCNFDFEKSLAFVINYGRDNDTTGAVTGAILGAYWGVSGLPPEMVTTVLQADALNTSPSLPQLAQQLTERIVQQR